MAHHAFPNGEALARNLADDVAAALERRLAAHGAAGLVVSGGRTPAAFLRELGSRQLDWTHVFVTLADERCVAADDPASNLRLLREAFAGSPASAAVLVAVDATGTDAASRWSEALGKMPRPFASVILGMGDDGHFASLFPGMPGLATALDLSQYDERGRGCRSGRTQVAAQPDTADPARHGPAGAACHRRAQTRDTAARSRRRQRARDACARVAHAGSSAAADLPCPVRTDVINPGLRGRRRAASRVPRAPAATRRAPAH